MKINYKEFHELQTQQMIRDYAHEIIGILNCLDYIVEKKHNKKILEMIIEIKRIEDEAIKNIREMIEGD